MRYCLIFLATSLVRLTAMLVSTRSKSIMKTVLIGGTRLTCGDSLVVGSASVCRLSNSATVRVEYSLMKLKKANFR